MQNKERSKSNPYGMPMIIGYVLMCVFACWGKMSIGRLIGMPMIIGYVLMCVFACWGKMSIGRWIWVKFPKRGKKIWSHAKSVDCTVEEMDAFLWDW